MKRSIPIDRGRQPVKGVFIFQKNLELPGEALPLMKSLDCTVLSFHQNRMVVQTSRSNLQSIKKLWASPRQPVAAGAVETVTQIDRLSQALREQVEQIIIGGNV